MFKQGIFTAAAVAAFVFVGCAAVQTNSPAAQKTALADSAITSIDPYQPRFDRVRPVVAVLGHSGGAEVTDFVVPYGVLAASGEADVVAVSTEAGPIEMLPALTIEPDATIEEFDRRYPEGADYVIVPAVHEASDPVLLGWIREQEGRGATIVGVCDGVLVLANAGVLEGRRATAHWYSIDRLERKHTETEWIRNQRYVADGNVVTTTGVSASIPVSLALVEAIAGRKRATEVAASLGIDDWSAAHNSEPYGVSARHVFTLVRNRAIFWRRDAIGIEVEPGVDEISLALAADMWSRTYRSRAYTSAASGDPITTRSGLRIIPDRVESESSELDRWLEPLPPALAGSAIDIALSDIAEAYGRSTAAFVALQIEYPWNPEE